MSRVPSPAALELADAIASTLADRFDAMYPPQRRGVPQCAHGTLTRYRKWKCRCALCRRAEADHRARMRANARRRAQQT